MDVRSLRPFDLQESSPLLRWCRTCFLLEHLASTARQPLAHLGPPQDERRLTIPAKGAGAFSVRVISLGMVTVYVGLRRSIKSEE